MIRRCFAGLVCALLLGGGGWADEGLWPIQPPSPAVIRQGWSQPGLAALERSCVRFGHGASGALVSPDGLVVTNHHVIAPFLSPAQHRAVTRAERRHQEVSCPGLTVQVLDKVVPIQTQGEFERVRARESGLVCELTQHGRLAVHCYRSFPDVRLVFVPPAELADFGGEQANFEFPRYALDVAFVRVYAGGKPLSTPTFFSWSARPPRQGERVFLAGFPGQTQRLATVEHLEALRRSTLPLSLQIGQQRLSTLKSYAHQGKAQLDEVANLLELWENQLKQLRGQMRALGDSSLWQSKRERQKALQKGRDLQPWKTIEACQKQLVGRQAAVRLVEDGEGFDSRMFKQARMLVRRAQRLPGAGGAEVERSLLNPRPVSRRREQATLAGSLGLLQKSLGGQHPAVRAALAGLSPGERARQLVDGTKMDALDSRRNYLKLDAAGLKRCGDPMIQLAWQMQAQAQPLRDHQRQWMERQDQAYQRLDRIWRELGLAPDADATLRLSWGRIGGYSQDGKVWPAWTDLGAQALPPVLRQAQLEPLPYNFVSTADSVGGNSGSPVFDLQRRLVGINFDRNRSALARTYLYREQPDRQIAVSCCAIQQILKKVYRCDALLAELQARPR